MGDFDAAMVLVQEMGQTFGYREEAEHFCEELSVARAADQEAKISIAIANLYQLINNHDFDPVAREAAKIRWLFSDSDLVPDLGVSVSQDRDQYKHDLECEFLAAAERDEGGSGHIAAQRAG